MEFFIVIILLIVGFYLLIKGADLLVDGSSSLAKRLKISEAVIGLTLIAFGTSLPETFVNIFASLAGNNDIIFGNIIGSNIFNLLLILGIAALINPLFINYDNLFVELPFSLFAALLLFVLANDSLVSGSDNILGSVDGLIFVIFFAVFLYHIIKLSKIKSKKKFDVKVFSAKKTIFYILLGFAALFVGAKLVLDNSVSLARIAGVSERLIALTLIAGGTSLPELATSVVAAYKKEYDLSVGNILGSSVFNILFILGISAFIRPASYSLIFNIDVMVLIISSVFMFCSVYLRKDRKLHRLEAFLFLAIYAMYIIFLFYNR